MQEFKLRKGLDLPVSGAPEQTINDGPAIRSVALLGSDYINLKPRVSVQEGDNVVRGQTIFLHKDIPEAKMVSPVTGQVKAIHRGPRRVLESVVIEISDINDKGQDFSQVGDDNTTDGIAKKLCEAGLWTSFKTRPILENT